MNYTSKQFHFHYIAKYTLIVKANFFYDMLYVIDEIGQLMVYMKYPSHQPSEDALKILSLPFQKVYITIPHQNLTFIPEELFDLEDLDKYQEFMENPKQRAEIESLEFLNIRAIYQNDALLYKRWKSLFPLAQFIPEFKLNLTQARAYIPLQGEVLGLVFHDGSTDIFLFINGQFKFFNTFEVVSEDDLNYFILNLFNVFGISEKVNKAIVSGIEIQDSFLSTLLKYSREIIQLNTITPREILQDVPEDIAQSYILDLPSCG